MNKLLVSWTFLQLVNFCDFLRQWLLFLKHLLQINETEFVALCADESVIYLLRLINRAGGRRVHSDMSLINSLPGICINKKDEREAERYANIIMTHKCNYRAIKGVVRM